MEVRAPRRSSADSSASCGPALHTHTHTYLLCITLLLRCSLPGSLDRAGAKLARTKPTPRRRGQWLPARESDAKLAPAMRSESTPSPPPTTAACSKLPSRACPRTRPPPACPRAQGKHTERLRERLPAHRSTRVALRQRLAHGVEGLAALAAPVPQVLRAQRSNIGQLEPTSNLSRFCLCCLALCRLGTILGRPEMP